MANKFIISTTALSKALKVVAPAVQKSATLPIAEYVKFDVKKDRITLSAWSFGLVIEHTLLLVSEIEFSFTIEFAKLKNILSFAPEAPVIISIENNQATVIIGNNTYNVPTEPTKDFPVTPNVFGNEVDLPSGFVDAMLNSQESISPSTFANIPFERWLIDIETNSISLVASDKQTFFLKTFKHNNGKPQKILAPIELAKAIWSLSEHPNMIASEQHIMLYDENTKIIAPVGGGKYVDYTVALSSIEASIKCDVVEMISSINAATALQTDKAILIPLSVKVNGDVVTLSTNNEPLSESSIIEADIDNFGNTEFSSFYNPAYILRAFRHFSKAEQEQCRLVIGGNFGTDEHKMLTLVSDDESLKVICMPILPLNKILPTS